MTILEVCKENGIYIPTLCYDEQLKPIGSCQICVVEVSGYGLVPSCATPIADGMVIETDNVNVIQARKGRLELFLS